MDRDSQHPLPVHSHRGRARDLLMQAMTLGRLRNFARQPWSYQRRTLLNRLWRINPNIIVPIRLSFGPLWLAQHEYSSSLLLNSGYETDETAFVQRVL